MQTSQRSVLTVFSFFFSCLVFSGLTAHAAELQGAVKIEQISASSLGVWTLLYEDGSFRSSADPGVNKTSYSFGLTQFGQTTLSVIAPPGMSTKINVYRNGEFIETVFVPQYSFKLYPNDNYRFVIQYALTRLGSIGVTSDPSGIRFRMKGPSGKMYTSVTPFTYKNLPAGRYTVTVGSTAACVQPAPQSAVVKPEVRTVMQITLSCDHDATKESVSTVHPTKRSLIEYAKKREFNSRGNRK